MSRQSFRFALAPVLIVGGLGHGAGAQVAIQPNVDLEFQAAAPPNPPNVLETHSTFGGGTAPFFLSDGFVAPPPMIGVIACSGTASGAAGIGLPADSSVSLGANAFATCLTEVSFGDNFHTESISNAGLLYKIKGPGAVSGGTHLALVARLHGTLSAGTDFGTVPNNGTSMAQIAFTANGAPGIIGSNSLGSTNQLLTAFGNAPQLTGDLASSFVDQSTSSTAIFAIDDSLETDFTTSGWLASVSYRLDCQAKTTQPALAIPNQTASCDFGFGDTEVSLESLDPSAVLEHVAPLRPTTPRSAVYLSPATGPIETFPGTPGLPSTVTADGSLGQGATGGGDASAGLPMVNQATVVETKASSHVDQSAFAANANATVVSEGQGATSLRYHITRLNGFSDPTIPFLVMYPSVNASLSATKGLDPSIVEHSSFELSVNVDGIQFFHFATLSLGSSNEDPPGLSGNLANLCNDQSTATTQSCAITQIGGQDEGAAFPNDRDELVLTVQSDCATSVTHPSGSLPEAHTACDASHTIDAQLVSNSADVVLTPVPEPVAGPLDAASACALAAFFRTRKRRRS